MPTFSYLVVDAAGKEKKGTLEAESREIAVKQLREGGGTVAQLDEAGALSRNVSVGIFEKKPKARDMAVFCRQFVSIVNAGVSVVTALEMLGDQTENRRLRAAVYGCKKSIEKGESLANAMREHTDVFSDLFITLVDAGEASGSLDVSFTRMADQFEKSAKLKSLVKKATTYPIILGVICVIVMFVLLLFVVPTFESMFDQMGTDLPGLTKGVIAVSRFMQARWYLIVGVILALVFGIRSFKKTPEGQRTFSTLGLKLPGIKKLTVKSACAAMARTLSTLLAAGIPLMDALEITASTQSNVFFREALSDAKDDVAMGSPLSEPLKRGGLFPPMVCHMERIGEETGNVEEMLTKLADYYEDEVQTVTQQLTTMLEPLMIVFMAVIVGTIVLSVVLAMAGMYSSLDSL